MTAVSSLALDLAAEHAVLDARLSGLTEAAWHTPTPAVGWDIADSLSHLMYFDGTAHLALTDPAGFTASLETIYEVIGGGADVNPGRTLSGADLLAAWRANRVALIDAIEAADPSIRVGWYGPPMGLASFITARLMETWAHGQDVADALGLPPVASHRLKHICHLGVGARPYSYIVNDLEVPTAPVRVEVTGPSGHVWTWGPDNAVDSVTGSALDFALLVTQRRHLKDTELTVTGPSAMEWVSFAQAFAGGKGKGRAPLG